jgi:radical SAM family uncharacterized protein
MFSATNPPVAEQRTIDHMPRTADKSPPPDTRSEIGTIRKSWHSRTSIALVYPNRYHVGMSNLGFQTLYRLFNSYDQVVCERAFLPEGNRPQPGRLKTMESGRPIAAADIIAFSLSFENDYPHMLAILDKAGIPLRSNARNEDHPFIIAGGVACFLNPEPIAAFIDCFLIGEAEGILPRFFEIFETESNKKDVLKNLARGVPGAYVPAFYRTRYKDNGTLEGVEPLEDVPQKIERICLDDLALEATCSAVLTPHTTFDETFLIETGRGCPHGCRFCSAGFIYRPPRFRSVAQLEQSIRQGAQLTDRIGLVGAAVSDLPGIEHLCEKFKDDDIRFSFSSLRADRLTDSLLAALNQSRVKTATIAPEVGSQRMRDVINKGLTENDILDAATTLVENGIPNLKLYFMIGLPTETEADVEAIISLVKQIKHRFLVSSRARKRIGTITVSLNSFVPKPFTPFQWAAMDEVSTLKRKIKKIKSGLRKVANLRINSDVPRWAYIQAMLSRGDRKVADILALAHANNGNWAQTLKTVPVNPKFYVHRERDPAEQFPWDFIDHGIKKSYLLKEYQRAKEGRTTPDCQVESCKMCGVC